MKILIAHGYKVTKGGLGSSNIAVINTILEVEKEFDFILIPCGWHSPSMGARPTIAECIQGYLVDAYPNLKAKVLTQFDLGLGELLPARNTLEEVFVAGEMWNVLRAQLYSPEVTISAVGVWFMRRRIVTTHQKAFSPCSQILRAWGWPTLLSSQLYCEPIARIVLLLEPNGNGLLTELCVARRTVPGPPHILPRRRIWKMLREEDTKTV